MSNTTFLPRRKRAQGDPEFIIAPGYSEDLIGTDLEDEPAQLPFVPWRYRSAKRWQALTKRYTGPICASGTHTTKWLANGNVLRCTTCGLDCT